MNKKRHNALSFYFLNIILFLIILSIIMIMGIIFLCPVSNVEVKGNSITGDDVIKKTVLSDAHDTNAVYAYLRNRYSRHKDIPFVASYRVGLKDRNTIIIKVKEKKLYGCLRGEKKKQRVYYDSKGEVLEVSKKNVEGVFYISGIKAKDPAVGETLPVGKSNLKTILLIQKELKDNNIEVAAVDFSEEGTITFTIEGILVNLGTRSLLKEKMERLPYILPKLEGSHGTLHLEEFTEENTDVVFEKE